MYPPRAPRATPPAFAGVRPHTSACQSSLLAVFERLVVRRGGLELLRLGQFPHCLHEVVVHDVVALVADRDSLAALLAMEADGWMCFFGLAIGIYILANVTQVRPASPQPPTLLTLFLALPPRNDLRSEIWRI